MKLLVIGAGSIARKHIRNLNELGYNAIDIVDPDQTRLDYISNYFNVDKIYNDFSIALMENDYNAAFILTPPDLHIPIALKLAEKKLDMFIEKPLSNSTNDINKLMALKTKFNLIIQIGYNLRYDRGLAEIKTRVKNGDLGIINYIRSEFGYYLPYWRRWQDYRISYSSKKESGGGIILDSSHELDYLIWLADSKIKNLYSIWGKISNLEMDAEDFAEISCIFHNKIIGSINLNMIDKKYNRIIRVIGSDGTIEYNFKNGNLNIFKNDDKFSYIYPDKEKQYIDELKDFFQNIKTRIEPLNNINNSKYILDIIEELKNHGGTEARNDRYYNSCSCKF